MIHARHLLCGVHRKVGELITPNVEVHICISSIKAAYTGGSFATSSNY